MPKKKKKVFSNDKMKNKTIFTIFILIFVTLLFSGCSDFFSESNSSVTYESSPTNVNYSITYGYRVILTGSGRYTIEYDLDYPEVLEGDILSTEIHYDDYQQVKLATFNDMIRWNIDSNNNTGYDFLITAEVEAESFIVSDLSGENALTIQEIKDQHPTLVTQYCQAQSNETTTFIDPLNQDIKETALSVFESAKTNNSYLVAKELFKWLKQHTTYLAHSLEDNEIQSAQTTLIRGTGDCDDLSFLYMSLCKSLNIPCRFIRGFLINDNLAIQHAWVEVYVGRNIGKNGWIPVECAGTSDDVVVEVNQNFGIENTEHLRIFTDDGSNQSLIISFSGVSYKLFSENRNLDLEFISDVENYLVVKSQQLVVENSQNRFYK
jgi:transglutaminase-like putative cysteine protease